MGLKTIDDEEAVAAACCDCQYTGMGAHAPIKEGSTTMIPLSVKSGGRPCQTCPFAAMRAQIVSRLQSAQGTHTS